MYSNHNIMESANKKFESKMNEKTKLCLVDVSQLIYRGSFKNIIATDGESEYNVGGIIFTLRKIMQLQTEADVILCFDDSRPYKKMKYPNYKANRGTKSADIDKDFQAVYLYNFLTSKGVNCQKYEGYEADDILQTLTYLAIADEYRYSKIELINNDSDLYHLCSCPIVFNRVIGSSTKPDIIYSSSNHWKWEPKFSLIMRLALGKQSNNLQPSPKLSPYLEVVNKAIQSGAIPENIASDPELFTGYLLRLIQVPELLEELKVLCYLHFPQTITEIDDCELGSKSLPTYATFKEIEALERGIINARHKTS